MEPRGLSRACMLVSFMYTQLSESRKQGATAWVTNARQSFTSHSSGGWKSQIKLPLAESVPGEGFLPCS